MAMSEKIVLAQVAELTYDDSTAEKLFTLPEGARPVRLTVYTQATSTGAELDVGTVSNDDYWIAALDVSAVGQNEGDLLKMAELDAMTDVYGLIQGSPTSGGPFTIVMEYVTYRSLAPK